ncbi:MAG: AzlD domain-containing protein [Erysipelotrichaceae bacterium]
MPKRYIYILIMFGVTYLIRVLPLTLIRKKIQNRYIKSFLYYVPYVTLSLMTFPAIVEATSLPLAGAAALILGIVVAYKGTSMLNVSIICCLCVFILELFLV